jgi:ABC-type Fe3+-hydroxamate transport system substrate-binding protein
LEDASVIVATYKGADALYQELGMTRNEKCQSLYESGEWYAAVSLETLPDFCGDYIIVYGEQNPFIGNAIYDNLEAVKAGRVILVDEYLVNFNDIISVKAQTDYLVEKLLEVSEK